MQARPSFAERLGWLQGAVVRWLAHPASLS